MGARAEVAATGRLSVAKWGIIALVASTAAVSYFPLLGVDATVAWLNLSAIIGSGVAAVLCQLASRSSVERRERWAWHLLALAFAVNMVAEGIWTYYQVIAAVEMPYPSAADALYLAFYPLAFAGLLMFLRSGGGRLRVWTLVLDSLIFTLGFAGLAWQLILAPSLVDVEGGLFVALTVAYPLGDLLLVFAVASLFLSWDLQRVQLPAVLLLCSFLAMVIADLGFAWLTLSNEYAAGSPVDPMWTLAYGLVGLAALSRVAAARAAAAPASVSADRPAIDLGRARLVRLVLPYLAFPAAAALIYLHLREHGTDGSALVVGLAVLLLGLVMVRQFLSLLENTKLSRSLEVLSHDLELRVDERTGELADRTEQLGILNRVATALGQCLATDEVLDTGLQLACEATGADGGIIWLRQGGAALELVAQRGNVRAAGRDGTVRAVADLVEEEPALRQALGAREPTLVEGDALTQPLSLGDFPATTDLRLLVVPLLSRGSVPGGLCLVLGPETVADAARLQLEQAIGAQLGVALENARQYDSARYLAERDPVTALYNHRALHKRLESELQRAQRAGGTFSLVMMDLDNFKLFNDTYGHPVGDEILREVATILSATVRTSDIVGRYGGDEFMAILPDTTTKGAVDLARRVRAALREHPYMSVEGLSVPIRLSFGVSMFPDDARKVNELVGFADTYLYSSKQQGGDTVTASEHAGEDREGAGSQGGVFGVLDGLVTAVDNKDRYTRHHSDDVTDLALALAQQLALSDESQRALRIAGLLHDVGKIGVPDRILQKPGKLTDGEYEVVKHHAYLSELIIKEVPNLNEVVAAVGSHHERYDGKGYPRGVGGEQIPLLGRILAVADAYSAMTTDRPYRKAMNAAEAVAELRRSAGSQLDPHLVEAFVVTLEGQRVVAAAG